MTPRAPPASGASERGGERFSRSAPKGTDPADVTILGLQAPGLRQQISVTFSPWSVVISHSSPRKRRPRFTALRFIALRRCCIFHKWKARPSTGPKPCFAAAVAGAGLGACPRSARPARLRWAMFDSWRVSSLRPPLLPLPHLWESRECQVHPPSAPTGTLKRLQGPQPRSYPPTVAKPPARLLRLPLKPFGDLLWPSPCSQ